MLYCYKQSYKSGTESVSKRYEFLSLVLNKH